MLNVMSTGKTTIARRAAESCGPPFVYASADGPLRPAADDGISLSYRRDGPAEVDFGLHAGAPVVGIEVESVFSAPPRGLAAFRADLRGESRKARHLLGAAGMAALR
jgi:hypothetical protein